MRRRTFRSTVLLLPSVFALLLLAGCGSDPVQPVVPGVEPEILNSPDTFQFQVSSVEAYSGTLTTLGPTPVPWPTLTSRATLNGGRRYSH